MLSALNFQTISHEEKETVSKLISKWIKITSIWRSEYQNQDIIIDILNHINDLHNDTLKIYNVRFYLQVLFF